MGSDEFSTGPRAAGDKPRVFERLRNGGVTYVFRFERFKFWVSLAGALLALAFGIWKAGDGIFRVQLLRYATIIQQPLEHEIRSIRSDMVTRQEFDSVRKTDSEMERQIKELHSAMTEQYNALASRQQDIYRAILANQFHGPPGGDDK